MKLKSLKKVLCLALALGMLLSVTAFAAEGETTVELPGIAVNGLITGDFPTDNALKTYINRMELLDPGSQITTADLLFVNKSTSAIMIDVDLKLNNLGTNVEAVADPADINVTDDTVTTKQAYVYAVPVLKTGMALVAAENEEEDKKDQFEGTDAETGRMVYSDDAKVVLEDTDAQRLSFLLQSAQYDMTDIDTIEKLIAAVEADSLVLEETAGMAGASALRLKGKLNPFASYEDGDINVTMVYNVRGVPASFYDDNDPTDNEALNLYVPGEPANVSNGVESDSTFMNGAMTFTLNRAKQNIPDTDTVASIKIVYASGTVFDISATPAAFTLTGNSLTLTKALYDALAETSFKVHVGYSSGGTLTSATISTVAPSDGLTAASTTFTSASPLAFAIDKASKGISADEPITAITILYGSGATDDLGTATSMYTLAGTTLTLQPALHAALKESTFRIQVICGTAGSMTSALITKA